MRPVGCFGSAGTGAFLCASPPFVLWGLGGAGILFETIVAFCT